MRTQDPFTPATSRIDTFARDNLPPEKEWT
jgi:hypothetical protein